MQWYHRRIRALLSSIHVASRSVLLANSATLGAFLMSPQLSFAENLLSGLRTSDGRSGADWDWDNAFAKFKNYVVDHESQLAKRLRRVRYLVDEANTLSTLIVGSERPETVSESKLHPETIVYSDGVLVRASPRVPPSKEEPLRDPAGIPSDAPFRGAGHHPALSSGGLGSYRGSRRHFAR